VEPFKVVFFIYIVKEVPTIMLLKIDKTALKQNYPTENSFRKYKVYD